MSTVDDSTCSDGRRKLFCSITFSAIYNHGKTSGARCGTIPARTSDVLPLPLGPYRTATREYSVVSKPSIHDFQNCKDSGSPLESRPPGISERKKLASSYSNGCSPRCVNSMCCGPLNDPALCQSPARDRCPPIARVQVSRLLLLHQPLNQRGLKSVHRVVSIFDILTQRATYDAIELFRNVRIERRKPSG